MNTKTDHMIDESKRPEENELVELGAVSEETKGGLIGHSQDGGFGVKKP